MGKNEEKKEKKSKKGLLAIIIIILLLAVIGVLCYFLFFGDKVTINTGGGTLKSKLEIKNGEIATLPVIEKEGYKVTAYVNENKKVVKPGSKVPKQIEPVYIEDDAETVKVTFMDGETKLGELTLEKGSELIFLEDQSKDGFVFGGWVLSNGSIIIGNPIVTEDITVYVLWIENNREYVTVQVLTAEEELVGEYKQVKGTKINLPPTPKKEGYAFAFWYYNDGFLREIDADYVLEKDIAIKPMWDKYECPLGCIMNEDGKTCNKEATAEKVSKQGCPSGAFMYYGKCITLNGAGDARIRQCDGDMSGREVYYGNYCAKVVNKVTITSCPDGYKEMDGTCKKTEIINCTKVVEEDNTEQ